MSNSRSADEMLHSPQTAQQAGEQPLGDRPLIVLTAGQRAAPGATPFDAQQIPADPEVIAAQGRLAALSSRGEQRVSAQSGHDLHLDDPEAVIDAARDVVAMIHDWERGHLVRQHADGTSAFQSYSQRRRYVS